MYSFICFLHYVLYDIFLYLLYDSLLNVLRLLGAFNPLRLSASGRFRDWIKPRST